MDQLQETILDFWSGNPAVDLLHGSLIIKEIPNPNYLPQYKSKYLCCPFIPTHMPVIEFCQFIEPIQKSLHSLRVLRSGNSKEFIVVLKFNSVQDAIDFTKKYQRRKFNAIEPDLCIIYQIIAANMKNDIDGAEKDNSSKSPKENRVKFYKGQFEFAIEESNELSNLKSPEILFTQGNEYNCPICFEQLTLEFDSLSLTQQNNSSPLSERLENSGKKKNQILYNLKHEKLRGGENDFTMTILCCHSFHWMCLKNWNDTTCPCCRYVQSPAESSACDDCGIQENLWVCLICGHIGCLSISMPFQETDTTFQCDGHSKEHYDSEKHVYAMDIETRNVWDFCKGNYVHRLISNQVDGKLIEFGNPNEIVQQYNDKDFTVDSVHRYNKKIEGLNYEYNQMLSSTLENQRAYFEGKIQELNEDEGIIIGRKRLEILDIEQKLQNIDLVIDKGRLDSEELKGYFGKLKNIYGEILTNLMQIDKENKILVQQQDTINNQYQNEIIALQNELKLCDQEIEQLKQEKVDLQQHVQMKQRVLKHKQSDEIVGGQAFTLDTGTQNQNKKGRKKNKK